MKKQPPAATDCIYLDHNATTPLDPAVFAAMEPYLTAVFGNPSSIEHEHGHAAAEAVEKAREQVAATIGARPTEIIFTGSCTEANNLALLGVARAHPDKRHIVTTQIEHPSVLEPTRALEREGWKVTYVGVDEMGMVSVDAIAAALTEKTAMVSVMGANNEVGTLQPIREIGTLCADRGVLFHSDLAQLIAYERVDVEKDNIHVASLSAHKAYGPKGIGALYVRSRRPRARIAPIIFGGGQERGLRPGTLNTPAIVGMGEAFKLASASRTSDSEKVRNLARGLLGRLLSSLPDVQVNGSLTSRLPSNLSLSIPGLEPLALIRHLNGTVSLSASSACTTDKLETSHVLLAMYGDTQRARGAFRISIGKFSSSEDLTMAAQFIVDATTALRALLN